MRRFIVIGNGPAHTGHVAEVDTDDPYWNYQQLTGAHGTVLHECNDGAEADRILTDWLKCDSVERGTYCYTHNPTGAFAKALYHAIRGLSIGNEIAD